MSIFYKLPVKEITKETQNTVSVVFDIPEKAKSEFHFIPGQYITIQTEIAGKMLRRAYSICSSPNSNELRVAIKEVEKGIFSVYANNKLKVDDVLEVAAPEGKFVLNANKNNAKNYLAFVAGSGITPVLSMIKAVLETEKESKFVLIYGSKSSELTIFKNELDKLVDNSNNQLEVQYVFSQKISDQAFFGRINIDVINDILKHKYNTINFDEYFLCGPEEMIDLVKESLLNNGVDNNAIKFELFSSTSAKKEINNDLSGNSKITIVLDDEETTLEMRKDEIILNVALAHDLDAPYSCQGGICSSCLARVVEGSAIMDKNTILDADEVEEGLILTCQAHPTTASIKIDFDDV
ncbi:MAG: 2Fe-2S iron-sulfur cluster binding domain-containing protein [Flavobacteriaceae bacterium]|nr:2Fe-2S iron-sulfur cluster binding domain-containing protein [Flavobacteriaceae bacterium]